ncbi:MAG: DUF3987 domain-containing protein [Burkholderiales bacterium]|nr:DUF3987 domain-containing protein [Burkholderiales bacterium]
MSGERKSTCDELFFASIRAFEQEQEAAARPLLARHAAALEAWTAKREGIKARIRDCAKNDEPTAELERALEELEAERPAAPRLPRLLRVDETPEHLVFALAHEWPSGAIVAAEGGLVFGSHAMGRDSIMRALALLNALWSGEPIRIGRRTAESFTVRGARLTVAIQAQEETLRAFVERTDGLARGSGFLSRFLIAWPRSTQGTRRFREPPASWPALSRFNRRIRELLEHQVKIDHAGALVPTTVDLTPEARSAWSCCQ